MKLFCGIDVRIREDGKVSVEIWEESGNREIFVNHLGEEFNRDELPPEGIFASSVEEGLEWARTWITRKVIEMRKGR